MPAPDRVAFDLLHAEAQAYPLGSPRALELGLVSLERDHFGVLNGPTRTLANGLEDRLRVHAGGMALETLAQLRDHVWFGNDDQPTAKVSLLDYTRAVARCYLRHDGNQISLREGHEQSLLASRWRWLSLRLPTDVLMAATLDDGDPCPGHLDVNLATPHLHELVNEKPVAETHVHIGNALRFDAVWTGLMAQLVSGHVGDRLPGVEGPRIAGIDGKDSFVRLLQVAGVLRLLLARVLTMRDGGDLRSIAGRMDAATERRGRDPNATSTLAVYEAVTSGKPWPARSALHRLLIALSVDRLVRARIEGAPHGGRPTLPHPPGRLLTGHTRDFEDLACRDPLALYTPSGARPELWLLREVMRQLRGPSPSDLAKIFWQYVRIHCLTYGHLTQDPGVAGLDWFRVFSGRLGPLRRTLDHLLPDEAFRTLSRGGNLAALELRVVPTTDHRDMRQYVLGMIGALRRQRPSRRPQGGLIVHFIKASEERSLARRRLHVDPAAFGWSYGYWYRQRMKEAAVLERFLRRFPETLAILRGLDIASTELAVPTFAIIDPIRTVRAASVEVAAELAHRRPEWRVAPMRVTCHAGEDYRRLSEGLRRMDELIEFGVIQQGDRIGHGLALGQDPERWASAARVVHQPRGERMADLVWELHAYGTGALATDSSRLECVRFELNTLSREIFGHALDPLLLVDVRRRLHKPLELKRLGFPDPSRRTGGHPDLVDYWLASSLCDKRVVERSLVPVPVSVTEAEVAVLRQLQRHLRAQIGRLEVTIESNPTSNLLIGAYGKVEDHPAFRMHPLRPGGEASVLLSLNSDDPLTFATRTCDEYSHVYHSLLRSNVDAHEALAWLMRVRDNGYRSRFTLEASRDDEVLDAIERSLRPGRRRGAS